MFQWFKNIDFCHYANMLEKDGILAFSTFLQGNFSEIREVTGLSLEYKTIDEITAALSESFEILHVEEFTEVLDFNSPLEVLAHMKNTGVNSLSSTHWTFKEVKEFCANYTLRYPKAQLTYVSAVIVARRRG